MLDQDGYRANVGIVLLNQDNQVFWGRRKGESSWQFPQGGISENEDHTLAMFRELNEELGLAATDVEVIAHTKSWLYYDVPNAFIRNNRGVYKGQKQIWYLLKLIAKDHAINVKLYKEQEFDAWLWIPYWQAIDRVIYFKQDVYKSALTELSLYVSNINEIIDL